MEQQFNYEVLAKLKRKKRKKAWKQVLRVMMCIVVFCTTYMLILPAITKETKTYCGIEEHLHEAACYRDVLLCEGHAHTDGCFAAEGPLTCTTPTEGHTHSEACAPQTQTALVCELAESEEHTHTDACYTTSTTYGCGLEETPDHAHGEGCYGEPPLTCTIPTEPGHTHIEACNGREVICGKQEHTHTLICYSDITADVETEEVWRATIPKLSGVSKQNIVAIAKSQLEYTESPNNYIVDENGNAKGYTRYGAWYGDPYGDWNAMFVAFCLRYAGVNYPYDASAANWAATLKAQERFKAPSDYVPESGDLVFFDRDLDGVIDHVGLVENLQDIKFTTIEGDNGNKVARGSYDLFNKYIVGYGVVEVPKTETEVQPDPEIKEEPTPIVTVPGDKDAWAELVAPSAPAVQTYSFRSRGASTFALRNTSTTYQTQARGTPLDLTPYINSVNMYDANGVLIPSGSMVTEGDLIEFKIEYTVTGQQLGVMNGNTITVNSNTLQYTLPKIFEMVQDDSGNIHNASGQVVGTYLIDSSSGIITMTFTDNYVEQNAKGIQIHGYISCFSTVKKVTDLDSESQDFEFSDNITLGVTIEKDKNSVGDLSIEKKKTSVDGEELIYEVIVTSEEGTKGSVTLTDEMSTGLTFVEGLGVWRANGSSVSGVSFRPSNDRSSFTMTLPEMAAGESYTVQYRCKADIDLLGADMTVRNTATVNGKDDQDVELEDKVTVEHNFKMLEKTGVANDDGTITWTITINQAKADISGWTLEDIVGGSTPYAGNVTIKDESGRVVVQSTRLPYTFPNGSNKTYVVTYTTSHTIAEGDTIYNKAILKDNDTEVTVVSGVGLGTPITKEGEAGEVFQDENGTYLVPITWTVTIDTTNSAIAAGQYFYDQMSGAHHTAELFMTYDQLKTALANMEAELNRVGSAVGNVTVVRYAEGYSVGQTMSLTNLERDANRESYLFERFTVEIAKEVPKGQRLTFTYETYGSFYNNVVADQDFKNCFNISQNYEVEGLVKFSSGKLKATKTALSYYDPSIPNQQWHWNNTDWNSTESTGYYEYEKLHDSYLGWSIELSVPPGYSNTDEITVFEDLPDGVTLKKLGMPFFSSMPVQYLQMTDIEPGGTYYWTFKIYPVDEYDKYWESQREGGVDTTIKVTVTEEGDFVMVLPGELLRLMGNLAKKYSQPEWYSYLFVYAQINDDFEWTPTSSNAHVYRDAFQNRFTIKDEEGDVVDVGSQTQVITKDESEGMIRKVASTDSNIITYSVILNAYGKDLMGDSGYVAVHDELTYTSRETDPLRVRLVPGSVKLYEIRLTSDGEYTKLEDVTPNYSYNEASTEEGNVTHWTHTLDMTVPDGKTLLLEYSYKVSGEENASHDIFNSCTISGVGETFLDGDHKLEIEVKDATAQADTKGIMLYKVDADSDGIFLEKARFNIYIWNEEQNKYIIVHHPDGSTDFVTDMNGMIVIDGSTIDLEQFAYNTAYYIVEVQSPEGYFLGPEPYYFYIANDNTVAYPPCIPENFTGRALVSGDIIYRKNVNELTKIQVEKYWQDENGESITVSGQEVTSVTLELWQMLQGDPNSAKRYGTYTMTPDEDGNWSLTITGLPKSTRNADGTQGVDYLYYLKEVGVGGYALESAENNAGINSGTIKLVNRKTDGYILPETGGIGTQMYTMAGLLLVLISTAFLMYNHRKRRREDYNSS